MTYQKPEALHLAIILDSLGWRSVDSELREASAMLRNQHAEIERLRAELKALRNQEPVAWRATDESGEKVEALSFNKSRRRFDTPLYFAAGAQSTPLQEMLDWPKGATHYQPQQKAFYKRVSACEWYVWSRITDEPLHWFYSPGTMDSAEWIVREQPAPSAPEGWKLVPVKPTKAMMDAVDEAYDRFEKEPVGCWVGAQSVWDAMLAAAPEAPKRKPLTKWAAKENSNDRSR